jgi:hypothetical protein
MMLTEETMTHVLNFLSETDDTPPWPDAQAWMQELCKYGRAAPLMQLIESLDMIADALDKIHRALGGPVTGHRFSDPEKHGMDRLTGFDMRWHAWLLQAIANTAEVDGDIYHLIENLPHHHKVAFNKVSRAADDFFHMENYNA